MIGFPRKFIRSATIINSFLAVNAALKSSSLKYNGLIVLTLISWEISSIVAGRKIVSSQ